MFIFEIHTFEQLTPKQPIMACRGVPSGDCSEIHVYMCVYVYLATPLNRQWIWNGFPGAIWGRSRQRPRQLIL